MEVANLLSSIFVTPVTGLCIRFLKHPISCIVHCEENLKQLKEKVTELSGIRNDLNRRVNAAQRNLESIHADVEVWLRKVENETSTTRDDDQKNILALVMNNDDDAILNLIINKKCWCSAGGSSRYSLGKRAKKKLDTIEKLLSDGKSFSSISEPRVIRANPTPTNNLMSFTSREDLKDEILAALREDKGTNLILVHGMGGVGKTTLVNQVQEHIVNEENELFDTVVKVVISQNVNLEKIQNEIAEVLGLTDLKTKENASARANLLSERLMMKNNLVILDDLWSPLNFDEVGIPCGATCKVIITARKRDVCPSFHNKKTITVEVLSEEDSWQLFKKSVGALADSPGLGTTPRDVANECGGLPLALVVLGSGLRDKGKPVWDNTLHHLRNSKIPSQKVLCSIKLSYENLEEEILKNCFLLCCLFPEDHEISIYELMAYVMGDDSMFDDQETLKQRTDGVYTMLDNLVDSCLLLGKRKKDGSLYAVSMHDVIRDVAIKIASEEGNCFLVKPGRGLKHWPSTSGNGKCLRRLSLMENEISSLPGNPPELPHLLSLSLYGNRSLKEIPNSFFEKMESLATLDLRRTGISFLPSSFAFLKNLKTLYLDGCEFNQPSDISVIGKLKKLEILSLAYCYFLSGLPEELRELTNLRLLNVESIYSRGFTIPRNVIGSLSRLEYLNMEGRIICSVSSLEDVASLSYLSGLHLKLKMEYHLRTSEGKENLKKFSISLSDATGNLMMSSDPKSRNSLPSSECEVDVSPPVCRPIKVLIQKVEILKVEFGGLKSLGQIGGGFNNLKELEVKWCKEMEYLMRVEEAETERPFVALDKLTLKFLYRLKAIFVGPIGWVDKLRDLEIHRCNEIVSIFDPNLGIQSAPNLESLKVEYCKGLKDVFNLNNPNNIEEAGLISNVVTFSRLRRMELDCLGSLENIWKGHNNIPFGCFENLEELKVVFCEKLRYLFSSSMARNLQNLKTLEISHCKSMVKLIEDDDDVDDERASILDFPALESLKVFRCKNLKRIRLTRRCSEHLKEFIDDDERRIEWEEPSDKLRLRSLFQQLESIPDMVQGVWSDNFKLQLECTTQFKKFSSSENFDRIEEFIKACVVPRFVEFLERQDQPQLQVKLVLLVLRHLIHSTDEQVLTDACEALYQLSIVEYNIQEVFDAGVIPRVVDLLLHPSDKVVEPALGTIHYIVHWGDDEEKQYVIDNQVLLPCLYQLLTQNHNENIKKAACGTIFYITRGNRGRIQAVIEANIFAPLVHLLQHAEFEIKKVAAEAISNSTSGGSHEQIEYLVNQGCIKPLCDLLVYQDPDCMKVCLKGLENILRVGEEDKELGKNNGVNIYAQMIDECKGLDKIRNLQSHDDDAIKKKAIEIMERYLWDMVQGVWSDNFELQLEFTTKFRKFSSSENFDRIEKVIRACVVPRFVEFLERQDLPKLQYEAVWALTNITSGTSEHTQVVIDHDDSGGSPIFNEHSKLSMLRNATRTLCEYCQSTQHPVEQVKLVLLALRHLMHSTDEQVLTYACRALCCICDLHIQALYGGFIDNKIQAVIDAGVLSRVVDLLLHPSNKVVIPILRTVRKIVGDDAHKQYILDNQVLLPRLYQLLTQNRHDNIKIIACQIISNITCGNIDQIQAVIEANIFAPLVLLLQHAQFDIKKAAAPAISNATSGGSREQIEYLVSQGSTKPLCDLLVYRDSDCMMVCLKGLENILKVGEEDKELGKNNCVNIYARMIDECKGLDKIRNLQSHDNNKIKEKAVEILEIYWWDMVQRVWSDNFELQIEFTTKFRKFSSDYNFDGIEKVIKACVVPRFVEFLERQDLPKLQYEAAWALTNITSGTSEHTQIVIDHDDALSMLRNATRTLCEYCEETLPFEQVKLVLLALRHLIIHSTDEEVLTDACSALEHISDDDTKIQAVIDVGVIPRIVDLLIHPSDGVVRPALGTINNIVFYSYNPHKQYILDNKVLPCLYQLFTQNRHEDIRIGACSTISNITRGNTGQIQAVIEANIFAPLVHLLEHEEFEIRLLAARAISNATSGGSRVQIEYLVNQGCIKPICDLLVCPNPMGVTVCLKGLENILRAGEEDKELGKNNGINIYAQMIDECKGLDKIINLQSHDDKEILKRIKRYWVEDEDEDDDEADDDDDDAEESLSAARVIDVPSFGDDLYFGWRQ